jgi:hypothetical protein
MNVRIKTVEALYGYRLRLTLSDGRMVERDVSDLVPPPAVETVYSSWRDPSYFAEVRLDTWPAPVWPHGEALDPDVLIWGVDADGNLVAPPEYANLTRAAASMTPAQRKARAINASQAAALAWTKKKQTKPREG